MKRDLLPPKGGWSLGFNVKTMEGGEHEPQDIVSRQASLPKRCPVLPGPEKELMSSKESCTVQVM